MKTFATSTSCFHSAALDLDLAQNWELKLPHVKKKRNPTKKTNNEQRNCSQLVLVARYRPRVAHPALPPAHSSLDFTHHAPLSPNRSKFNGSVRRLFSAFWLISLSMLCSQQHLSANWKNKTKHSFAFLPPRVMGEVVLATDAAHWLCPSPSPSSPPQSPSPVVDLRCPSSHSREPLPPQWHHLVFITATSTQLTHHSRFFHMFFFCVWSLSSNWLAAL